jgi:purine-cytosine permease-like protein
MNALKRILGFVWFLTGPSVLGYLLYEAMKKNSLPTSTSNDMLQWAIIIGIFIPIAIGFMIFGYYSIKGEYDLKD